MKHIAFSNIVDISADSENAGFPVERLLDEHPKRKWKAASISIAATVTLDIIGGCSDIMVAGTNAATASVLGTDPNAISWGGTDDWGSSGGVSQSVTFDGDSVTFDGDSVTFGVIGGTSDEWANPDISVAGTVVQDAKNNTLWIVLDSTISVPCEIAVTLTGPGGVAVQAGVIRASIAWLYGDTNPKYGIEKEQEDFSISAENSNGSTYYKKRDVVRVFDLVSLMLRSESREMEYFFKEQGENPTAWRLTDEDSNDYVVFGKMKGSPKIRDDHPTKSLVSWRIDEVI